MLYPFIEQFDNPESFEATIIVYGTPDLECNIVSKKAAESVVAQINATGKEFALYRITTAWLVPESEETGGVVARFERK